MGRLKIKTAVIFFLLLISAAAQNVKELMKIPIKELMNIEVTVASKKAEDIYYAPGIITVITREEINGFAAINLGQVLNRVVGTSFLSANVFSDNLVQLRGQSLTPYNNHTLILLNGRPIRDPISGGLNSPVFTAFPLNVIDHIEIIRGPGSVLYGSCAYSGVINIVTRKKKDNLKKIRISAGGGSYKTIYQNGMILLNKNKFASSIGISHLDDAGPKYSFTGYEGVKGSANFDRKTLGITAAFSFNGFHFNSYYGSFYPYALSGPRSTWTDLDPHSSANQKTYFADAGYTYKFQNNTEINANFTYNRHYLDQEGGNEINSEDFLFETSSYIHPDNKTNILAGAVIEKDLYRGQTLYNGSTLMSSLYVQTDYHYKNLKFIAGMQYNKIENIKGNFSPRAGIISNISDKIGFKLFYGQAFRKAYPLETSFNHPLFKGNLNIKPELIRTAEVQVFFHNEKIQTLLTFYESHMLDIIYRKWIDDPESTIGKALKYFNAGIHDFSGVEFEGKYFVSNNLYITGSFYFQKNKNDAGVENAALHPDAMAKIGVLYHKNRFRIGIFNSYFGKPTQVKVLNPDVDECNPEAEAYNLLSLKISYQISKTTRLSFMGDNLFNFDIRYPEYTSRGVNTLIPLYAGRVVWGEVSYNFTGFKG